MAVHGLVADIFKIIATTTIAVYLTNTAISLIDVFATTDKVNSVIHQVEMEVAKTNYLSDNSRTYYQEQLDLIATNSLTFQSCTLGEVTNLDGDIIGLDEIRTNRGDIALINAEYKLNKDIFTWLYFSNNTGLTFRGADSERDVSVGLDSALGNINTEKDDKLYIGNANETRLQSFFIQKPVVCLRNIKTSGGK